MLNLFSSKIYQNKCSKMFNYTLKHKSSWLSDKASIMCVCTLTNIIFIIPLSKNILVLYRFRRERHWTYSLSIFLNKSSSFFFPPTTAIYISNILKTFGQLVHHIHVHFAAVDIVHVLFAGRCL